MGDGAAPGEVEEPDLLVVGDHVALGPLRLDLASTYARWVNQLEARSNLLHLGVATPESEAAWVEETMKAAAEREPSAVGFTVYDRRDLAPVGTSMLFRVSHVHGSPMRGLGLGLGDRRGQGWARRQAGSCSTGPLTCSGSATCRSKRCRPTPRRSGLMRGQGFGTSADVEAPS